MGCTISSDAAEPNSNKKSKNKIIGTPSDYKPLTKHDQVRIDMILDYWYDEKPWSENKHKHYRQLIEQVKTDDVHNETSKETQVETSDNKIQ
jgi:hypothetical protein